MEERPFKKRKVRKGTRSCWQCRKRKIRCESASNDDQICVGCNLRGTSCVSQEFIDDESSGPPERGLAQRLGRLEELMVKLADKIGPEAPADKTTPAPSVDGSLRPSESLGTPDNLGQAETAAALMPSLHHSTPSRPAAESPRVTSKHEKICKEIYSMFPSPRAARSILESSKGPIFVLILFYSNQDILEGRSPPTASLAVMPDTSKHPAVLAKHLLQLTICLQQLPPCFDASQLGFKGSIQDTMNEWVAVASQVTSNDELIGSAEGLECLVLQCFYLINAGNLRKAWLATRRALSLAQLMGIERNGSRPLKSCDPTADPALIPASHQFWYRINFCDRSLSLLLGLPAGTQDNSFMSDAYTVHDTPIEKLEKHYTVISLRIIERNHASANEAYAMTQSIDCELEQAAKMMGRGWWEIPPIPDYTSTDTTTKLSTMSHLMLQIHHHSFLILLHLPYMLRNPTNPRFDYSKNTCLESSRAVLRRCVIFRTANNAAFSCRHIDYSSLMAAMTLLLGHLSRPPGVRDDEWARQRTEDRALAQTVMAKMEELATLNDDKLSGESADIIKQLLPIIDGCNECVAQRPDEAWNVQLIIPYLGTININSASIQAGLQAGKSQPHTVDLSHSQLPTPTNTTTVSPVPFAPSQETSPVVTLDALLGEGNLTSHEYLCYATFNPDYLSWPCPGITAEAGDWAFQGVDTTYWSLLNSGMNDDFSQ